MSMSERIRNTRKERGYTLKYIADMMGVSEATVQRWESGNIKNMRHSRIAKLSQILGVEPTYLIGWEEIKSTEQERRMLETYAKAKSSDRLAVKALVEALDKLLGVDGQETDEGEK